MRFCRAIGLRGAGAALGAGLLVLGGGIALEPSLGSFVDHTLLAANATPDRLARLCDEAAQHSFRTVCVNPSNIRFCAERLKNTQVGICAVVGFPLGATLSSVKAFEAAQCISEGATEIDMVINVGALLSGRLDVVRRDIEMVRSATQGVVLKVILETCLLTPEQIVVASRIAEAAGADFVKTSTGFSTGGATLEHVALMRKTVGPKVQVKASGGVKTAEQARAMIAAGATRIGTSSGVDIVNGVAPKTVASNY